ncbi:MAG: hypothetical protein QCH96_05460 [Candidatus Thermoplasmatota archaeon]|nr:hypothetical protein [Candidatus Thermoplasmatota archaeon]
MNSFPEHMIEYKKQIQKGAIPKAYRGLMEYIMSLRTYLCKKYPRYNVPSTIYFGYMDMTYFSFFPDSLKHKKLKIGIVFVHETFRFEVWLFGYNKTVQEKYWKLIKENDWTKYHRVPTTKGFDSIIEHILVDDPDFSDLDTLTKQIETKTLCFIKDVEDFLLKNEK